MFGTLCYDSQSNGTEFVDSTYGFLLNNADLQATPHFACDTCRMKKVGRHCLNASSLGRVLTTIPSIAQMQWPKNRLRSLQSHVKLLRVQPHRRRHPRETTETWRRPTERQEPALGFALTIKLGRQSQKILVTAQGAASRPTRKFPK